MCTIFVEHTMQCFKMTCFCEAVIYRFWSVAALLLMLIVYMFHC